MNNEQCGANRIKDPLNNPTIGLRKLVGNQRAYERLAGVARGEQDGLL